MIFFPFFQVNNLFLHQSHLKSPLPVKLTRQKTQKIIFVTEKNTKCLKCPALVWTYLFLSLRKIKKNTTKTTKSARPEKGDPLLSFVWGSRHKVEHPEHHAEHAGLWQQPGAGRDHLHAGRAHVDDAHRVPQPHHQRLAVVLWPGGKVLRRVRGEGRLRRVYRHLWPQAHRVQVRARYF